MIRSIETSIEIRGHQYVFRVDPCVIEQLEPALQRFVDDPELDFTAKDADVVLAITAGAIQRALGGRNE